MNGRAEIVVHDVASYQRLLDRAERAEAIEGIRGGLESAARGEGRPAEERSTRSFENATASHTIRELPGSDSADGR